MINNFYYQISFRYPVAKQPQSPLLGLSHDLRSLMLLGSYSDVTVTAGNKVFNLHKAVLASEWAYFFSDVTITAGTYPKLCLEVSWLTFFLVLVIFFSNDGNPLCVVFIILK